MADEPTVDVVVVSYRCEGLLRDCLRSVFEHAPAGGVTVRVVDNASGDATAAMVRREFPQVELTDAEEAERRERFPTGAAIEFVDLEEHGRAPALDRLREAEPVSWVPALGGWLVTSHPLARNVLARTDDFTVWAEPNLVRASLGVMMLTSDPPEHELQRQPFDDVQGGTME